MKKLILCALFNVLILFTPILSHAQTTNSIWSGLAVPATSSASDSSTIELGVKFQSDVAGQITGIRFYKGSANTGTHTGKLWSLSGQLLNSLTFAGESSSGWQQANFAAPISIAANTVYIASYHTNVGRYAFNNNYFASQGVDNPPLHALRNGVNGGNGVYQYGASAFPNQGTVAKSRMI